MGNPVEIGIAVIWRVVDTAKAVFNVDNYKEYLSLQCDSALRNIVRIYPYDVAPNVDTTGDHTGRRQPARFEQVVANRIKEEIQAKYTMPDLRYGSADYLRHTLRRIAAVMLQRQQACCCNAQLIVDGAVGMVQMALDNFLRMRTSR